jgi:hypothetical protein
MSAVVSQRLAYTITTCSAICCMLCKCLYMLTVYIKTRYMPSCAVQYSSTCICNQLSVSDTHYLDEVIQQCSELKVACYNEIQQQQLAVNKHEINVAALKVH